MPGSGDDVVVLAHGLGGGGDLPIPAGMAIAAGTAALLVSFVVLLFAWRTPRFVDTSSGRPAPGWIAGAVDSRWFPVLLRAFGLLFLGYVVWAAVFGPDLLINPVFGITYVWLWVGIVPFSLLLGPVFRALSPARTLHLLLARVSGGDPEQGVFAMPARLGYWPAAVGLFAFVWLELVLPSSTYLGPVRIWFALYFAAMLIGGALFGSRWLERADPFEVYSNLLARLSVWGRDAAGELVLRHPLRNLAGTPVAPGLVGVIAVLLGSTAYDSFRESPFWLRITQTTDLPVTPMNTVVLLASCVLVGVLFAVATMLTGVDRDLSSRWSIPGALAHSVLPIIVGYMVAHYLSYFVEYGQLTLIQASDPMNSGADLLGTAGWQVHYWLSENPTLLATLKVLAIVVGHVLGVIAAHDKAIQILPARSHVRGQLPLLVVMVIYTFGGLYLLFGV